MTSKGWKILGVLAAAQFLMVLDQAVMNVSISQLVSDFDTDVTTIQAVIALYSLVMAAFMVPGGKLGDILGRRRTFTIGLLIYGTGSLLTAVAWSVPVLMLGWSVLEGIGAALVLPALVALTARSFEGKPRALAYGVLGGVSGAGIAVGPILGGWVTTNLTWRLVFAGEVVVVIAILLFVRLLPAGGKREGAKLDGVGAVLCDFPRDAPPLKFVNRGSGRCLSVFNWTRNGQGTTVVASRCRRNHARQTWDVGYALSPTITHGPYGDFSQKRNQSPGVRFCMDVGKGNAHDHRRAEGDRLQVWACTKANLHGNQEFRFLPVSEATCEPQYAAQVCGLQEDPR